MRSILAFIHIIVAYILLKGWPEVFPMWLRAALALIIIMLAFPLKEKKNATKKRIRLHSIRKPHWMDFLYIGSVILVIELLLLSVFTLFPKAAEELAIDLHDWATFSESSSEETLTPDELSTNHSGNWLWDNHSQRPLASSANIKPSNRPEIFIDLLNTEATNQIKKTQIYIKSFSLDYFDGQRWSIHQPTKYTINKLDGLLPIKQNLIKDFPIYTSRVTQTFHNNGQNVFSSIHNPLSSEINSLTKVNTDTYLLPTLKEDESSYNYITTAQPINLNDVLKRSPDKTSLTLPEIDSVYLSKIPDYKLQQDISELAKKIPDNLSTADTLLEIRKFIQKHSAYSLTVQNPNQLNPIDNFLFHERKGYCEHFATATALLCREHGIPSRISYGWTGGKHYLNSNLFAFLSKNAHAWTEVNLQGYGWVIFDTTPPSNIQANQSSDEPAPTDIEDKYGYSLSESDQSIAQDNNSTPAWKIPMMILFIGTIFTTLILLIRKLSTSPKGYIRSNKNNTAHSPPKYMSLFEKLCIKLGQPCSPGITLAQSIAHLEQVVSPEESKELHSLLEYHYGITYRNTPTDKVTEHKITKSLKQLLNSTEVIRDKD